MSTIPSKDRKEWRQLLNGEIEIKFSNFFYQAKILQAREQIKNGKISIEDAIDEIYELTTQYCEIDQVSSDINQIFGTKLPVETVTDSKIVIKPKKNDESEIIINKNVQDTIVSEEVITSSDIDKITPSVAESSETLLDHSVSLEKERAKARKEIEKRLEEERKRRENDKKRKALVKKAPIKKPVDAKFVPKQKTRKNKPVKKAKPKNKSFWDNIFGK